MTSKLGAPLVLGGLFIATANATASGGLWCNADDANLLLAVESGMSRGMGGAFFNFTARVELRAPEIPADFRTLDLAPALVHHWVEGGDIRLLFYHERAGDTPHGYVEITIKTPPGDPDDDAGSKGAYELTWFEAERQKGDADGYARFTGDVACGME